MVLTFVFVTAAAMAADDKKAPAPVSWSTTLPAIQLSNRPLEAVLNDLKTKMPGFDFTISRENVPHDYPILPEMTVENISLWDFMELLRKELPATEVNYDAGSTFCHFMISPGVEVPPQIVKVFGLDDVISYRATLIREGTQADREKQVSNDVLSLVQAALELSGTKPMPVLKVHPQTQTLLFKGSEAQADIVTNTLAALQPTVNGNKVRAVVAVDEYDRKTAENKQLKDELLALKASTQPANMKPAITVPAR